MQGLALSESKFVFHLSLTQIVKTKNELNETKRTLLRTGVTKIKSIINVN